MMFVKGKDEALLKSIMDVMGESAQHTEVERQKTAQYLEKTTYAGMRLSKDQLSENFDKSYDTWQRQVLEKNPDHAKKIKFVSKPDQQHVVSAEHGDRSFGTFNIKTGKGEHLGEEVTLTREELARLEELAAGTTPKTAREKELAAKAEPKDKITHADVMAARGVTKEEVESIDEISKQTALSYRDKAQKRLDISKTILKRNERNKASQTKEWDKMSDVDKAKHKDLYDTEQGTMAKNIAKHGADVKKREAGIARATTKLTKEEVELDEASVHPDAVHVSDAGAGKYKVHAVGKNFADGIKVGEHLSDSELDDFQEMGGKVKNVKKPVKEARSLSAILGEARGRPRKEGSASGSKPTKSGDDDEYGPDTGPEADQNIMVHLRKSTDTEGKHDVKFSDGSSHKVPAHVAHKVLSAVEKLKPADRAHVQAHIQQSHKNLMDVHKMVS